MSEQKQFRQSSKRVTPVAKQSIKDIVIEKSTTNRHIVIP